jgi:NAD(P)-dependent dehydrogenase (short-subunit alcohol dehydrogenase family)
MKLANKTAIVTGGSNGIGEAIAIKLNELGARVIIFDIRKPSSTVSSRRELSNDNSLAMKKPKTGFDYFKVDITKDDEIKSAINQIEKIDILVNNAGVYFEKYLEDTTDIDIDFMVDINIKGTFKVTRNAIDKIKKSKGCIVNIASCLGIVPEPTSPLYCATKAGIVMLTKSLAGQYADLGVRVNCVCPGATITELLENSFKDNDEKEICAKRIPMRRIGTPQEVANVVAFLTTDDASYVTGSVYCVDGGISGSSIYSKT